MSRKVRCLVVRVGQEPEIEELDPRSIGKAVGGAVELLLLEHRPGGRQVVAFIGDDAVHERRPPNRIVPTAIPYYTQGGVTKLVPVLGDLVVVAATRAGNEASLDDADLAEWATKLQLPWRAPAVAR